ncbi:flagellar basal body rod protein FlgB [Balneatrix alpica]|uniref:flagellar basal body rod protein FlgB n=1 Tax=Balneatrix alpica TaxID=75684 RepID=UPI00273894A3|nr:flagellar basal body rod protein FlgB [Balneatrix alpica]
MSINFNNALGIHADALLFRAQRAEVLANNLANADTPHYKAKDLDFGSVLAQAEAATSFHLRQTHSRHLAASADASAEQLYTHPIQPAVDGNTVDPQVEKAKFMQNAMDFQTSFTFLNRKFQGLTRAIKGE